MEKNDALSYLLLYKAALLGDWSTAKKFFDEDPEALVATISPRKETALHVAIASGHSIKFVQNLVYLMGKQGKPFDSRDVEGNTPLHYAAVANNVEAAKLLVSKDPSLHRIKNREDEIPLVVAALWGHRNVTRFFYLLIKDQSDADFDAVSLFFILIKNDLYDIALILLKRYHILSLKKDHLIFALSQLAQKPHAFSSGSRLGYWQHFLSYIIPSPSKYEYKCFKGGDIENKVVQKSEAHLEESKGRILKEVHYGFLKEVYYSRIMHSKALELLRLLISKLQKSSAEEAIELLGPPTMLAAENGILEFVREVIKACPTIIMYQDTDWHSIFDVAVKHRQENVYNLLYQMGSMKYFIFGLDKNDENILHLAAKLEPADRIEKISGAALQMQRELQWYKEVERLVQLMFYKEKENVDEKDPAMLFIESHEKLRQKGEAWMKKTAESCSVVATLVVGIVFAAVLTVPGNTNNFTNEIAYVIFVVANAFALFSSSTSMLMFLGMLTSRYSMEDFFRTLPMRLAIGLITLFFSIVSMLVAFIAALYIVLAHQMHWIAVPIGLVACLPVTSFALLQFPLLVEIVASTFGPSIFGKKGDKLS